MALFLLRLNAGDEWVGLVNFFKSILVYIIYIMRRNAYPLKER